MKLVGFQSKFFQFKKINTIKTYNASNALVQKRTFHSNSRYPQEYARSLENPEEFWAEQSRFIDFVKPYDKVFQQKSAKKNDGWFSGGQLNMCYNAVDRHAQKDPNRVALIYDSPVTKTVMTITYGQLLQQVQKMAGVLLHLGVKTGDRVIIYNPAIPHSIIAMLVRKKIHKQNISFAFIRRIGMLQTRGYSQCCFWWLCS